MVDHGLRGNNLRLPLLIAVAVVIIITNTTPRKGANNMVAGVGNLYIDQYANR